MFERFVILVLGICLCHGNVRATEALEKGFETPPDSTRPWCYWYWISDNISKDGITRDLEAMKKAGLGGALIGNIEESKTRGTVKVLSPEWWGMIEHAIREGARLGIDIGLFNCPGWSQSGGPWVKTTQAMRYLASTEKRVSGPVLFNGKLPSPPEPFQDVSVLAFPAPRGDDETAAARGARITTVPAGFAAQALVDGDLKTACRLPAPGEPLLIDFEFNEPFTARSLTLFPERQIQAQCELQAVGNNQDYRTLKVFPFARVNNTQPVGPMTYGPLTVAFPVVASTRFRLVVRSENKDFGGLAEVRLSSAARLEKYVEKQLGKMFESPQPMWDTYLWPVSVEPESADCVVSPDHVVDLSDRLMPDGSLRWNVPAGEWVILRTAMRPTGATNSPASPEGTGLEVDKLNREPLKSHFNAYIGHVLARMPVADRKAFKYVVADSYETGSQNWTDGFDAIFAKRYGYDPQPWLPVLTGRIVGSADQSDRFLWDLRRLVADRVAYEYVGGLRDLCAAHGLTMWLENYGHWGYPAEFLQYGGQSARIGGEFWLGNELGRIECRAASSAAHIYGHPVVSAEAFTSAQPVLATTPELIKRRGDWSWTEGINHFVFHVYIHQPWEDRVPGMNAWFGTEFNRHNTWFPYMGSSYTTYMRRSHFLLQQGKYVADVAYFIGEDAPKMTGVCDPALPPGYSFDYINGEVILDRLCVKDGRLTLPDGMSYRLLVLPPLETMRPAVLRKIASLIQDGAMVYGPKPRRSPSLESYPTCDVEVQSLAEPLWGDGKSTAPRSVGKGMLFPGGAFGEVLTRLTKGPDVKAVKGILPLWIHRQTADADVYFLSNQEPDVVRNVLSFRVEGKKPELWDAVTGVRRPLPEFQQQNGRITMPLTFAPGQSHFIVFRDGASAEAPTQGVNFPEVRALMEITGPWDVAFHVKQGGPAKIRFAALDDWSQRPEDGIRFYSGPAVYRKTFNAPGCSAAEFLDLGCVKELAVVRLNGRPLGTVWTAPWRVAIPRGLLKERGNTLEVEVVNAGVNRLIGAVSPPLEKRVPTWAAHNPYKAESPLRPSGLLGPVTIQGILSSTP